MIYTIGYQKNTLDEIFEIMEKKNIDLLVDVRSVPYSRNSLKYEFNKNRLYEKIPHNYLWFPACGGKQGKVTKHCIQKLLSFEYNVLLMCLENNPADCHRHQDIAKRLLREYDIDVIHIFDGQEVTTSDLISMEVQHVSSFRYRTF